MKEREDRNNMVKPHEPVKRSLLSPFNLAERFRGTKDLQTLLTCVSCGGVVGLSYAYFTPPSLYFVQHPEFYTPACILGGGFIGGVIWAVTRVSKDQL